MTYSNLDSEQKLLIENQNLVYEELQIFQHKVLDIFKQLDFTFVFTGGTALSLIYLNNHRRSYDMDFFGTFSSNQDDIFADFEAILEKENISVVRKKMIKEGIIMLQYVLLCDIGNKKIVMKVEFVEDYFYSILYNKKVDKIDNIDSIYFRKIYTLTTFNKNRIKDLIDLVYLDKYCNILDFYSNHFLNNFSLLTNETKVFNSQVICNNINLWLKHFMYNEHIIILELEKYGSILSMETIDTLFRNFCTKICYNN